MTKTATYRHAQQALGVMLQVEVLVGEALGAVDARGACAVAVDEVTALAHKFGDLAPSCQYFVLVLSNGNRRMEACGQEKGVSPLRTMR
jgi:hypothetical protein